jgi:transposase
MSYKTGVDKKQLTLLPVCLDEYIAEDHICRVISEFTEQLDMAELGYRYAECKNTGCRPYDPRMMLKLYIYGYLHRTRSSRRLRDEAIRNVEVMWLLDGLTPDDKTICNFRKDNAKALRESFRIFVRICRGIGLYGEELVATDGSKYRANNSLRNTHGKAVVKKELERIELKIDEYMKTLEQCDQQEAGEREISKAELKAALERLKERKVEYEGLQTRIEKEGEGSTVDYDARLMRSAGGRRSIDSGYNVQMVVDGKYHLIVDFEVTQCSADSGELYRMSERAKEEMEVEELTNLADRGYYNGREMAACEKSGVTCLVAKKKTGGQKKAEGFTLDSFVYDEGNDRYVCPSGAQLTYRGDKKRNDREYRRYANYKACAHCQRRPDCTKRKWREIDRLPYQGIFNIIDERTLTNKALYQKRKEIVEHPFGTVKAVWGYKQFLCRTLKKVTAEISLAYLAYNMRRVVNIFKESKLKPVFA